jgi:GH24 family phage-related lysozyme (muramidase)
MNSIKPSDKTLKLLFEYEVGGGKEYYDKFLSKFTWPKGASGPTIGIGIDCAYYTPQEIEKIFNFLPDNQIRLIKGASGKTGESGKEYTKILRKENITVNWEQAIEIFNNITWKKFTFLAEKTFPSLDKLCPDAYGAIVSLVFNRGTSLKGPSRLEMLKIRDIVPQKDYNAIASQIRKMKRLWVGKNMEGLITRRESEAKLVESCI